MIGWLAPYWQSSRSGDEPEELRATAELALGPVLEQADTERAGASRFDESEDVLISFSQVSEHPGLVPQAQLR